MPARRQGQGRADAEAAFREDRHSRKRPIGKAMAKRLGEALGVGYKVFL